MSLLIEAHSTNIDSFGEIAGAAAFLAHLQQHPNWRIAIATGSWERPARFKMTVTGINADGIPASFAEDGPARETIVEAAISKACAKYRRDFEKIVFVGDALSDVRTAQRLGLPFVGIGNGGQEALLRSVGANEVIDNFLDHNRSVECFDRAVIPKAYGESASRV